MKPGSFKKIGSLAVKTSRAADGFVSKLVGIIFLVGGLGLFAGILFTGGTEVYQQITWPSTTAMIDSIESRHSGSELLLFLTVNEKDGGVRSTRMDYTVTQSMESDDYAIPYFIYEGATITVLYPEEDPSRLVIATPIWGFFVALLLPIIFVIVGYLQLSTQARMRFDHWNKDWRLWWSLFFVAGLACFIMACFVSEPSPESVIQSTWLVRLLFIGLGLPLFLIGGYKLMDIFRSKSVLNDLITSGIKMEFHDFNLEENKYSGHRDTETGKVPVAYIIKCVLREHELEVPFVYTSNPILYDPRPHLPEKITVYVNPADKYEYHMDLSFLPASDR